jgi:hypothetical protein
MLRWVRQLYEDKADATLVTALHLWLTKILTNSSQHGLPKVEGVDWEAGKTSAIGRSRVRF